MPAVLVWTVAFALHFVSFLMLAIPLGTKRSAVIVAACAAVEVAAWQRKNLASMFQNAYAAPLTSNDDAPLTSSDAALQASIDDAPLTSSDAVLQASNDDAPLTPNDAALQASIDAVLLTSIDDAPITAELVHNPPDKPPAATGEPKHAPTVQSVTSGRFPVSMYRSRNASLGNSRPVGFSESSPLGKPQAADYLSTVSSQQSRDSDYVIRVEEEWPEGYETCIHESVAVAGVTHGDRQKHLAAFIDGTHRKLELERDAENEHDRYAIKVFGIWRGQSGTVRRNELGWLPSEIAREVCKRFGDAPIAAKVTAMFRARLDCSAGMRIEIGCPSSVFRKRMASAFQDWLLRQDFHDWWNTAFTVQERDHIASHAESLVLEPTSQSALGAMRILSLLAVGFVKPDSMDIARRLFLQTEKLGIQAKRVSDLHFFYQSMIDAYYRVRDTMPNALDAAIAACEKQIDISPRAAKAFRRQYQGAGLPGHRGYEQLAIIREKQGNYTDAIRLSEQAERQGWAGKWRKRIERCKRSLARAKPQGN